MNSVDTPIHTTVIGHKVTPTEQRVMAMIEPAIIHAGFRLVQLRFLEGKQRGTLQVMAEPLDGQHMTVEHCSDLSYLLSAMLEVEDPIATAYNLEVTSPGIDRPLVSLEDFQKYLGFKAKVETVLPVNGRRRFRGVIHEVREDGIVLDMAEATVSLNFDSIASTKLELTDDLVRQYLNEGKKREQEIKQQGLEARRQSREEKRKASAVPKTGKRKQASGAVHEE